ncbi:MAG: tetratricopeptide repeat protein [Candidatus Gastranaerophilaceae bacterium]
MKKIFLSLFFIFVFSAKVFAADYYFVGADAFKKGAYDKAAANLEHAVRISPKNVNARYYLAQTYLRQKRNSDAIEQYNRIILLAPSSDAAMLSEKGLYLIKKSYQQTGSVASTENLTKYKDNYLDYVLTSGGQTAGWKSFPLKVYIEPQRQKVLVQNAFKQWQAKSGNLVSFSFINSPEQAQIKVDFKNKLENSETKDGFVAGYSKPYYMGDNISKSEIHILTADPNSNKIFDDNFIFASTLHEIGHSLGFNGHSPNENDVMAASGNRVKLELTQRDLNTLNMFYKMDKKTLLAKNNGQNDVQLQQALEYARTYPEKSVSWANLGDIYYSKKMYSEAVKNYRKAVSIDPDKAGLYGLLGAAYAGMGDKQNSFTNSKKACDLDKSNTFYLYQFAQICLVTGNKEVGKNYISSYLKSNPQGISDEKIRSLLKLYN